MKRIELIMGMPITIEITNPNYNRYFKQLFDYFRSVDERFSTYKPTSEISLINSRALDKSKYSDDMKTVLKLCDLTKKDTDGYFDIVRSGKLDPSGLVKGWAVNNAAQLLINQGVDNFYIDAGGDIQTKGLGKDKLPWSIGIKNPFNQGEIIKVIKLTNQAVATSGNYIRGNHIYNPRETNMTANPLVSLSVIAKNIYEADRYATAAFAMGANGINFIENTLGLEGYMVTNDHLATMTSGFEKYVEADK